jgi:SpoVK/Ycf46/Vps4 family AAA+-type ATPase
MDRKKNRKSDPLAGLPPWARTLAERYYTRTISTFLLHGAVRDLQPAGDRFVPLRTFLTEELFGARDAVIFYDRSSGIRCATPEMQQDLTRAVQGYEALHGTSFAGGLPRDPARALQLLESYLRVRLADGKSAACILDFAETLAPAGDFSYMSADDRFTLVTLVKWAQDPVFLAADVSFVLIAENLSELHPRIARNAYAAEIEIPLPDEEQRAAFLEDRAGDGKLSRLSALPLEALAKGTAGLSRVHLDRLVAEVEGTSARIDGDRLKERKKEILQSECHGLLEFLEPRYDLSYVPGHEGARALLRGAAAALKAGRNEVLPMGYLVAGPVGTGKTFLTTCFAGEVGIPCVKFLNFRSQWQGVTEGNLERIFNLLKAMWPVAVIIDEADAALGTRQQSGDSGTSSRVFASIAAFMGDTEYRGKIVWFLLTSRPDLLPVDLKRQGRAEEHLALFYPQSDAERDELFRAMARKQQVKTSIGSFSALLPSARRDVSGADIEAMLTRARFRAVAGGRTEPREEDLAAVIADFVPPSYPLEIELQNLVAVLECTSRELIPAVWRDQDRSRLTERAQELQLRLGR